MDHPARRSGWDRWIRGRSLCLIAATATTVVLRMVHPVHMRDAGVRLVWPRKRLLRVAPAAAPAAAAALSVALTTSAHLLQRLRGLLPVAAVLQDRRSLGYAVGLLPPDGPPIRAVQKTATRRVRE